MQKLTITAIKDKLDRICSEMDPFFQQIVHDDRTGVQQLIERWKKKQEHKWKEQAAFKKMSEFENKWRAKGYQYIVGIDEVGRGPLAGPVVASAVVLKDTTYIPGLNDSKKLSEKKRAELYKVIENEAVSIGIGVIDPEQIDELNIYQATKKAMLDAIQQLTITPDVLLIDAMELTVPFMQESIIKGDSKSISIAAASIIAKQTRDEMMKEWAKLYPVYGFEKNMGYGTRDHLKALELYGPTPIHRKSFAPVKDLYI